MSTIIAPIATKIAAVAATITGVTAYDTDPGMQGLEGNPAIVVSVPNIDRGELDADLQLGRRDWRLDYPVSIYVDLDNVQEATALLRDTVEAFIQAIDADDTLTGSAIGGVRVTSATPAIEITDTHRPRLLYECNVSLLAFV